jgi:hypothetical protein
MTRASGWVSVSFLSSEGNRDFQPKLQAIPAGRSPACLRGRACASPSTQTTPREDNGRGQETTMDLGSESKDQAPSARRGEGRGTAEGGRSGGAAPEARTRQAAAEEPRWNYLTGIHTKWHRSFFYLVGDYASPGPNALSDVRVAVRPPGVHAGRHVQPGLPAAHRPVVAGPRGAHPGPGHEGDPRRGAVPPAGVRTKLFTRPVLPASLAVGRLWASPATARTAARAAAPQHRGSPGPRAS